MELESVVATYVSKVAFMLHILRHQGMYLRILLCNGSLQKSTKF